MKVVNLWSLVLVTIIGCAGEALAHGGSAQLQKHNNDRSAPQI